MLLKQLMFGLDPGQSFIIRFSMSIGNNTITYMNTSTNITAAVVAIPLFLLLAVIVVVTLEEEKTQIPTTKHTKLEKQ